MSDELYVVGLGVERVARAIEGGGVAEELANIGSLVRELPFEARRLRAAVILGGFLAERSQSPMSYSQMVSKAVALSDALDREVR